MTEKDLYHLICKENPAAIPVFARSWWLNAVCDGGANWDVAVAIKGAHLTGVWPYVIHDKVSISMLRNPLLTPYLGPHVFFAPDIKESNRDSFEFEIVEELLAQLPNADVWGLSLKPGFKQAGIFRRFGLRVEVQQTFLLDLSRPVETIFMDFKESLRRNIKIAGEAIRISSEPQRLNDLYEFQKSTFDEKRVVQAYSEESMQKLLDACIANNSGAIWVARKGGQVQAIIWNVWDAETSYYFMGAKNPDCADSHAMSALIWHCIREAKFRGISKFDFEGSMDNGVERFFRSFGGKRELYLVLKRDGHWLWRMLRFLRLR